MPRLMLVVAVLLAAGCSKRNDSPPIKVELPAEKAQKAQKADQAKKAEKAVSPEAAKRAKVIQNAVDTRGAARELAGKALLKHRIDPSVVKTRGAESKAEVAFEAKAKPVAAALKANLKGALQKAIAEKGPAEAVSVCNLEAAGLTAGVAKDGLTVGRTAIRLRNPKNAPEEWMKQVLIDYVAPGPQPRPAHTLSIGGGKMAYVEPLYADGVCLTCHGQPEAIPADVKAKLATLYPSDRAIRYNAGEFRGMIWVTGAP